MRRPTWQASAWRTWAQEENGQTMAEYATLLGILIIAVIVAIGAFTFSVDAKLKDDITTILTGV